MIVSPAGRTIVKVSVPFLLFLLSFFLLEIANGTEKTEVPKDWYLLSLHTNWMLITRMLESMMIFIVAKSEAEEVAQALPRRMPGVKLD
jgi:hypothetical protein